MSKQTKLLIVEDDLLVMEIMAQKAKLAGYNVVSVANGEDALAEVSKNMPDIILLDIELPTISGFDVLKQIRQDHPTENKPWIVVVSGCSADQPGLKYADAFVPKPCSFSDMLESIDSENIEKRPAAVSPNKEIDILIIDDDSADIKLMCKALNNEGYQRISFVSTGAEGLNKLKSADFHIVIVDSILPDIPGVELCQRIQDLPDVHAKCISITGSVGAVDVEAVSNAGVFDSIVKSSDYGYLVKSINRLAEMNA